MRAKLLGKEKHFAQQYLRLLVKEMRIKGGKLEVTVGYKPLAHVGEHMGSKRAGEVPRFTVDWLPGADAQQKVFAYSYMIIACN